MRVVYKIFRAEGDATRPPKVVRVPFYPGPEKCFEDSLKSVCEKFNAALSAMEDEH